MPKVIYLEFNGTRHELEADNGTSVMQAAVDNMLPGILGDCGGSCSCATCHVFVDPAWAGKLPGRSADEALILDGVVDVQANSRLSCQIKLTDELDGIVVQMPEHQG